MSESTPTALRVEAERPKWRFVPNAPCDRRGVRAAVDPSHIPTETGVGCRFQPA
jgi:hypothetical protein